MRARSFFAIMLVRKVIPGCGVVANMEWNARAAICGVLSVLVATPRSQRRRLAVLVARAALASRQSCVTPPPATTLPHLQGLHSAGSTVTSLAQYREDFYLGWYGGGSGSEHSFCLFHNVCTIAVWGGRSYFGGKKHCEKLSLCAKFYAQRII